MDHDSLASALVERLSGVLPPPIYLVAIGKEIEVGIEGRTIPRVEMDVSTHGPLPGFIDLDTSLRMACLSVLDTVQDFVAEVTTDPWPGTRIMPEPTVELTDDAIVLRTALPTRSCLSYRRSLASRRARTAARLAKR